MMSSYLTLDVQRTETEEFYHFTAGQLELAFSCIITVLYGTFTVISIFCFMFDKPNPSLPSYFEDKFKIEETNPSTESEDLQSEPCPPPPVQVKDKPIPRQVAKDNVPVTKVKSISQYWGKKSILMETDNSSMTLDSFCRKVMDNVEDKSLPLASMDQIPLKVSSKLKKI